MGCDCVVSVRDSHSYYKNVLQNAFIQKTQRHVLNTLKRRLMSGYKKQERQQRKCKTEGNTLIIWLMQANHLPAATIHHSVSQGLEHWKLETDQWMKRKGMEEKWGMKRNKGKDFRKGNSYVWIYTHIALRNTNKRLLCLHTVQFLQMSCKN